MTARVDFLNKFIIQPQKIGSVTPSSSFLTRRMLADLPWDDMETIVELGAGTGVFTAFIAENKKESCQGIIVEQDSEMREALQNNYPSFYYGAKAEELDLILQTYDLPQVDCIISGLPFAIIPKSLRRDIMEAIDRSLKPGGLFLAFQYSLQMHSTLKSYFAELRIKFVPLNLPPAFIYFAKK